MTKKSDPTKRILRTMLVFLLMMGALPAQAQEDSIPFDELEADLDSELQKSEPEKVPDVKNESAVRETLEDPESESEVADPEAGEESLEGMFEGDLQLADPEELESMPPAPTELQTPPPAEVKVAKPKEEKAKEESKKPPTLTEAEEMSQEKLGEPDIPPALRDEELQFAIEDDDDPSDLFSKIPLRDPLSDLNWRKFAGPALEKVYRVRKKDTLWAISERFFGNPYLWPKVWQLNANLGNPHEIDPKIEMTFQPGQPNSAPALALRMDQDEVGPLYLVENDVPLTLVERLEKILSYQNSFPHPPFQTFLLENEPLTAAVIPKQPKERERKFYYEGDSFDVKGLAPGVYSIVELQNLRSRKVTRKSGLKGTIVKWVGVAKVNENQKAKVEKAFTEIETDHVLISESFWMSPLSLRMESVTFEGEKGASLIPIQEGALSGAGAYQILGVNFNSPEGPSPGALLTLRNKLEELGTALVIHRQGRFGTVAIVESKKEIGPIDELE
jgi:nucleoid-associated protein YgaU